jgi:hypothetical protein
VTDNNVIKLAQPGAFTDSLTEILRSGARALLTQAVEAEVAEFLAKHTDLKTETGQQRVVRHGHLPEREIMTEYVDVLGCSRCLDTLSSKSKAGSQRTRRWRERDSNSRSHFRAIPTQGGTRHYAAAGRNDASAVFRSIEASDGRGDAGTGGAVVGPRHYVNSNPIVQ